MPTTRAYITATEVSRAATAAEKAVKARREGKAADLSMTVISDVALKGLRLISVNGVVSWALKTSSHTKTLGYVYPKHEWPLTAPEKARELAGQVKALLKTEPDKIDPYLDHRHAGKGHDEALAAIVEKPTSWTFEKCVEVMLEDRSDPQHKKYLKPNSKKDVETTFRRDCLKDIKATPAVSLMRADFEKARDTIRKEAGVSPAQKFVAWTRATYSYMAEAHSGEFGIDGRDRWWELLHATHAVQAKTRNPEVEDIVKSLILAEAYLDKPLPGRAIAKPGVGAGVLAGLWWVVMTCQRGDAALSLKTYNLFDDDSRGNGWKLAGWEDELMKAGYAQLLPIPPRAAAHIEAIRMKATNHGSKQWAFPSDRDPDKHATVSGTYRILYRLAGRDALEQKKPDDWKPRLRKDGTPKSLPSASRDARRDLFEEAGIAWWSGHDVRRRIQRVLDLAGIPGGTSAVLAHEMKSSIDLNVSMTQQQREDYMRQRQARITAQAYGGAHFLKLKSEAMELWTDALLDEYDRQKAARDGSEATAEQPSDMSV